MIVVSFDIEALEKSLDAVIKEAERKMQGMVQKFTMRMSLSAISHTPMGDSDTYASLYLARVMNNPYGSLKLSPIEGFAQGSWQATPDSDGVIDTSIQEFYGKDSGNFALNSIERSMSYYKLGQTVFISNTGPYINALEHPNPKAKRDQTHGQGIMQPTLGMVYSAIQAELDDYYHKS